MGKEFEYHESHKHGFGNQESYIITKEKTSYLRFVGNYPKYSLMTVTANEDDKSFYACKNKIKLIESAIKLGLELNVEPSFEMDSSGMGFIMICDYIFRSGDKQVDLDGLECVIKRFFEIFDDGTP